MLTRSRAHIMQVGWFYEAALIRHVPLGVPGDLPEMTVRVMEVARIFTPEAIVRRISDHCTCLLGLLHHCIDLFSRLDDVPYRHGAEPRLCRRNVGIFCERGRRLERQYQVVVHLEKDHRAILELLTNNPTRRQTHAIAVVVWIEGPAWCDARVRSIASARDGMRSAAPWCGRIRRQP